MATVRNERYLLLRRIENLFEGPLIVLGFVWLLLLIIELVSGSSDVLETLGIVIWTIFISDFVLKFILAPVKTKFLKANILTLISLVVPAVRVLRVFRLIRLLRLSRSLRLVKVLGSMNRSMRSLAATMKRRALGYVLMLTIIVIFAGSAAMYAFERDVPGGLNDYGTSLWWTTMIMTTLGSEYWPVTTEGRVLCVVLSVFAFAVFGYITASIATFFIGKDAEDRTSEIAGSSQIDELRAEIIELKKMIRQLSDR